ncbi:MAG: hypothetical protein KDA90_07160 [Planctomycetaceae bacterium]|nr:hypothetical protein [Planctomycetaceae bacterium]
MLLKNTLSALTCGLMLVASGCGPAQPAGSGGAAAVDEHGHDHADAHAHPTEGPHHGDLIELGNEEFHAEMVHDAASVTIYILDGSARNLVPIDATDVTINAKMGETPRQFKLAASRQESDPEGQSSRFTLADAELAGLIDDEAAAPRLSVTINGNAYRGTVSHHHDGEHDHAHE